MIPFDSTPNLRELRGGKFDVAVVFPNSFRSAWECLRARIPTRVGFGGHHREGLLTHVVAQSRAERPVKQKLTVAEKTFPVKRYPMVRHQVHHYLDVVSFLGGNRDYVAPKIWIEPVAIPPLTKFVTERGRPCCGIHAGAEYGPAKRWMPERFAEAAARVSEKISTRWLLFGSPTEVEIASLVEKQMRRHFADPGDVVNLRRQNDLVGTLRPDQVLQAAPDQRHRADASGQRVGHSAGGHFRINLSELTGPLTDRSVVVQEPVECSPCFLRQCPIDFRCMSRITVDRVVEAALRQLGKT